MNTQIRQLPPSPPISPGFLDSKTTPGHYNTYQARGGLSGQSAFERVVRTPGGEGAALPSPSHTHHQTMSLPNWPSGSGYPYPNAEVDRQAFTARGHTYNAQTPTMSGHKAGYDMPEGQLTPESSARERQDDDESVEDGAEDAEDEVNEADLTPAERLARKRKMKRFRLTHSQTRFLMNEFAQQAHPDAAHRERLSREIPGLSPRQVQVWFQNRRAKLKRLTAEDQERMMKSRALPPNFNMSQSLQAPFGMSVSPTGYGSYGASSGMRPITGGVADFNPYTQQYTTASSAGTTASAFPVGQQGFAKPDPHPASTQVSTTPFSLAQRTSHDGASVQVSGAHHSGSPLETRNSRLSHSDDPSSHVLSGMTGWGGQVPARPLDHTGGQYSQDTSYGVPRTHQNKAMGYPALSDEHMTYPQAADTGSVPGGPAQHAAPGPLSAPTTVSYRRSSDYYPATSYAPVPNATFGGVSAHSQPNVGMQWPGGTYPQDYH